MLTKLLFSLELLHNLQGKIVDRCAFISDLKTWKEFISLNSAGIDFQLTDPK